MKCPKIISLGEVLWDLFPEGARFGGAPANFACHAAMSGADVTMVSAVGNDEPGQDAIEILGKFGIDTSLIQTVAGVPTGTVGVEMDAERGHQFTIHEDAAWDHLTWTSQLAEKISHADAVYFGTLAQRSASARSQIQRVLDEAKSAGVLRILDVNLREPFFDARLIRDSVALASVLKLSEEELDKVVKEKLTERQKLQEEMGKLVAEREKHVKEVLAKRRSEKRDFGFDAEIRRTVKDQGAKKGIDYKTE